MRTALFLLAAMLFFSLAAGAASPEKPTLTLRYQPPAAVYADQHQCGVRDADVQKACKQLRAALRKQKMDVQFGTFSGTADAGHLWIDGQPVEALLGGELIVVTSKADCESCGCTSGPEGCRVLKIGEQTFCRVTVEQMVQAGLAAAEKLEGRWEQAQRTGGRSKPTAAPHTAPVK